MLVVLVQAQLLQVLQEKLGSPSFEGFLLTWTRSALSTFVHIDIALISGTFTNTSDGVPFICVASLVCVCGVHSCILDALQQEADLMTPVGVLLMNTFLRTRASRYLDSDPRFHPPLVLFPELRRD